MAKTFDFKPLGWSDTQEREVLMQLREPKLVKELRIPKAKVEMGAINPHQLEEVKRWLGRQAEDGHLELAKEDWESVTGSRHKTIQTGKFKLTEKGMKELTRRNKEAAESPLPEE